MEKLLNPCPPHLTDAFALLEPLASNLVRGTYDIVVGGNKRDANVVLREDVPLDEFKGIVSHAFISKDGNLLLCVRTMNRITPGSRMEVTDAQLIQAALDPRLYKSLPGEYKFRSYRFEGIRALEVCRAGQWIPLITAPPADRSTASDLLSFTAFVDRLEAAQAAASGGRPDDGQRSRFDTYGEGGF